MESSLSELMFLRECVICLLMKPQPFHVVRSDDACFSQHPSVPRSPVTAFQVYWRLCAFIQNHRADAFIPGDLFYDGTAIFVSVRRSPIWQLEDLPLRGHFVAATLLPHTVSGSPTTKVSYRWGVPLSVLENYCASFGVPFQCDSPHEFCSVDAGPRRD